MFTITRRRLALMRCAKAGLLRATDMVRLRWNGLGLDRQPSEEEIETLIDAGLVEHVMDEERWVEDTKTGERWYGRIARLTPKGQRVVEEAGDIPAFPIFID